MTGKISMNIAIIGAGNVGSALAQSLSSAGHKICFGVREPTVLEKKRGFSSGSISFHTVSQAASLAETIIIAAVPTAVKEIASSLGDVSQKVIIDAMNSLREKPSGFSNSTSALLSLLDTRNVAKCFNTTGFENMKNPGFGSMSADMFVAGDSAKAKAVATALAKDIGFETVYDFGGSDTFELWSNINNRAQELAL